MEKYPKFLKEFSKKESQAERDEVAKKAWEQRSKAREEKKDSQMKHEELEKSTESRENQIEKMLEELSGIEKQLEDLSGSKFQEIKNYFKIRKIRSELALGKKSYEELKEIYESGKEERDVLAGKINSDQDPSGLNSAKKTVEDFYERQAKKWSESGYDKEEIKKYFSEDYLASLNVEEYKLLMERFPNQMVTHVTRQGIRDHSGEKFHKGGIGEYNDGFIKMTDDGCLKSPLAVRIIEDEKKEALRNSYLLQISKTKEEALERLVDFDQKKTYNDISAIHFATEEVADEYYGAERGNEIFIAYPSLHIASQYLFAGALNRENDSLEHNDQWVWANEEKGMKIDAGIVFIPADAKVDKKTGSRYQIDENMKAVKKEKNFETVKNMAYSEDLPIFIEELKEARSEKGETRKQKLEDFRKKFQTRYGIEDQKITNFVLEDGPRSLDYLAYAKKEEERVAGADFMGEGIFLFLKKAGTLFKEIEETDAVSSKEFWESYFEKNPGKKPSKLVYYNGGDPTEALINWRGPAKETNDESLGFEENKTKKFPEEHVARPGFDRYKSIFREIIEEHFSGKK